MKTYLRLEPASKGDRVLIVAPHIDDEVVGAAGYAMDARTNGAEVFVAFLTVGDANRISAFMLNGTLGANPKSFLSVGRTRIAEARAAMRKLGVREDHYFILAYPDRRLRRMLANRGEVVQSASTGVSDVPYPQAMSPGAPYRFANLMSDMRRVVAAARPTVVIAPVRFDGHEDHGACAEIVDLAFADFAGRPGRLGFLVHGIGVPLALLPMKGQPLVPPWKARHLDWAMYPLSPAAREKKDALLRSYRSQWPYNRLLRNAFVRANELFLLEEWQQIGGTLTAETQKGTLTAETQRENFVEETERGTIGEETQGGNLDDEALQETIGDETQA